MTILFTQSEIILFNIYKDIETINILCIIKKKTINLLKIKISKITFILDILGNSQSIIITYLTGCIEKYVTVFFFNLLQETFITKEIDLS